MLALLLLCKWHLLYLVFKALQNKTIMLKTRLIIPIRRNSKESMLFVFLLLLLLFFQTCTNDIPENKKIENIHAFTKLYGYVRWFHPSDEAQEIDWKKFAVYGVKQVEKAPDDEALRDSLLKLFRPIAPTLIISLEGERTVKFPNYKPDNPEKFKKTYWQHLGVDLGGKSGFFKSRRINRPNHDENQQVELSYMGEVKEGWAGKKIRLSFEAKSAGKIKVFFGPTSNYIFKKIVANPTGIQGEIFECNKWGQCQMDWVPSKSDNGFIFGIIRMDSKTLYIDNIKLDYLVNDQWKTYAIENGTFKFKPELNREWPIGVPKKLHYKKNAEWVKKYSDNNHDYCLKLPYSEKLFQEIPHDKPSLLKSIGSNLNIRLPIMLYATEDYTYPIGDTSELIKLKGTIEKIEYAHPYNWLGAYVIAWNIIEHFFPYHDEGKLQWKKELEPGITALYNTKSNQLALKVFRKLMSKTKDGHLTIQSLYEDKTCYLPLRWQWINEQLLIIGSRDNEIPRGSIVKKIEDQQAKAYFNKVSPLGPAPTKGYHFYRMEKYALKGACHDSIKLSINVHKGKTRKLYLHFNRSTPLFGNPNDTLRRFRLFENGIVYCNLERLGHDSYINHLDQIKNSKAVIFDLRNYPSEAALTIITQLLKHKDTIKPYQVPKVIFPDREKMDYKKAGWNLEPAKNGLSQPVVFLTNSMAISYAESILLWVKHYGLGTIIGQPTAGTNGNVNSIWLPIGKLRFTGLKVEFPDGTQHFARGVLPDIEVKQTVEAFREGRDLQLEKAVEYLNEKINTN